MNREHKGGGVEGFMDFVLSPRLESLKSQFSTQDSFLIADHSLIMVIFTEIQ